jgi:hypothetical protein
MTAGICVEWLPATPSRNAYRTGRAPGEGGTADGTPRNRLQSIPSSRRVLCGSEIIGITRCKWESVIIEIDLF